MKLKEAIAKAIKEFGNNIIQDTRFVNVLADYGAFAPNPMYRVVLANLVNEGFTYKLYNAVISGDDYDKVKNDLLFHIQQIIPFQYEILEEVIDAILSCYLPKPAYTKETAPAPLQKENRICRIQLKPKVLGLADLADIEGFKLGDTSILDLKKIGFTLSIEGTHRSFDLPNNVGTLTNEFNFSSKLSIYTMYKFEHFPKRWCSLGFDTSLSFEEWDVMLKGYGFVKKTEREVNLWGLSSTTMYVVYISYDNTLELNYVFSTNSCIFDRTAKDTFDSLKAKAII